MQKPIVKVSELIKNLKVLSVEPNDGQVFLNKLKQLQEDFNLVKSKNAVMFSVQIDSDDDFLLNGKSFFEEKLVSPEEDFYADFLNFFKGLSVFVHPSKKSKYEDFEKLVFSKDFKNKFSKLDKAYAGFTSFAGNSEIHIQLLPFEDTVDIGFMLVELD